MMSKSEINDSTAGVMLLLLLFLAIHLLKGFFILSEPDMNPCTEKVFVGISGDIAHPGVYAFPQPPYLKDLVIRAGGFLPATGKALPSTRILYHSGANVDVKSNEKETRVYKGEMSAFFKITLGIPISLNREPLKGLTAIPGIGPKIASAIVRERTRRGGFERLEEILSIQGIGPALYRKIIPYLVL